MSCAVASSDGGEAHVSPWFDGLSKVAAAAGGRCFVLMQRSADAGDDAEAFDNLCGSACVVVKSVALAKLPSELHPLLLHLDLQKSMHWQILDALRAMVNHDLELDALSRGCVQRVCAFIFSNDSAENVERAIRAAAIIRLPRSSRYRWMRFYDPIVGLVFWPVLEKQQRIGLLSGISSWCFVDPWKNLHVISGETAKSAGASHSVLRLTDIQWSRLAGVGSLHQAWLRAKREKLSADRKSFDEAAKALFSALALGLHGRLDMDYFAWQIFQYGPAILNHPKVERMIRRVDSNSDYIGLAQEVYDNEWHMIGEEAKRMNSFTRSVAL